MKKLKRVVDIGGVKIGGDFPIAIQSMCNTKTEDVDATLAQIERLKSESCEIVRLAVRSTDAAAAFGEIKKRAGIPLVADIHFDYRLALLAIENGADKIRINPGNIGSADRVKAVAEAASKAGVPIRIGVNTGSVTREKVDRLGRVGALVESVTEEVGLLESIGFENIVIAVKSSNVMETVEAARRIDALYDYPLHIGITETGTLATGLVKSAVGLGILLNEGIGDTIRVSLSADPVEEVRAAKVILSSLGLRRFGVNVVACPTCGRTEVDVSALAEKVEEGLRPLKKNLTVAVMGCIVNGPGEAMDADLGVAGGRGEYLLFSKGRQIKKVSEADVLDELLALARNFEVE